MNIRKRNGEQIPPVAARYVEQLSESVLNGPQLTPQQHIAAMQPTPEEKRHWQPLVQAVDINRADTFTWQRETGDVQSYQSNDTRGWLHIDPHGQFYDRHAQPISRELALQHVGQFPSLHTSELSQAKNVGDSNFGQGFSL